AENETTLPLPEVKPFAVGTAQMVSESPAMLPVFRTIAQVAPSSATVLVMGESGTGKELVARAVHLHGPRATGPFIAVNCAAIPENLLESELFGHERGAFTGAVARKVGRFERAHGGTLFLDEIGDMSLVLQAKILRALASLIAEGEFREDLFYRLAVVRLHLPPLRERRGDVRALALHYTARFAHAYGRPLRAIS